MLIFILDTSEYQGVSGNARFKAIETVSTTVLWLEDKEEEIIQAFGDPRRLKNKLTSSNTNLASEKRKFEFIERARNEFGKYFGEKKETIFKSKRI